LTEKTLNTQLYDLLQKYQNKTYLINISEQDIVFGREMKYKRVVKKYKLLNVDGLRKLTKKNKIQYRKDKINREGNNKQGNEYG